MRSEESRSYKLDRLPMQDIFWKYFENTYFDYHCVWCRNDDNLTERGGYENDVFVIEPYYWGEDEDIIGQPNFIYKPENITIEWYKYPMRGAYSNVDLTLEKADEIFRTCRESMVL